MIFLNVEDVDYYNEDTLRTVRGPMYAFDWRAGGPEIHLFHRARAGGWCERRSVAEKIINSVRPN